MNKIWTLPLLWMCSGLAAVEPLEIGSRWELFVDDWLVGEAQGAVLQLQQPVKREVVLVTDQPWEGPTCAYFSAVPDEGKVLLYYRGSAGGSDLSADQVTCVAESTDGVHFTRPKLGLFEAGGTKENNVVWRGVESHNFAVFRDTNPATRPEERFKALGGLRTPGKDGKPGGGLYAFVSADGLHWRKMQEAPVITKGAFDSQNLAFWDVTRGVYACYSRIFSNRVRAIQSCTSADFVNWTPGKPNVYATGVPLEHFYTSATLPCPTAPHLLLAFPKRFVPDRKKIPEHATAGVSDAVFMSSRDGLHWDRPFLEAWVRPGPDPKNWTDRNTMTSYGIIETAPEEWSMYVSEHYRAPDNRLRRITLRKQGFASMHAGAKVGEFVTKPLRFAGSKLHLNYATSAAGAIQVELQDEQGAPLPGFGQADMAPLYGDELEAKAAWKGSGDVGALAGKAVRIRVVMKDADLFAIKFGD